MYSPDERRSIRAEMQRDAMPSPDEVDREPDLTGESCRHCGEEDADKLNLYNVLEPECPAVQTPLDPIIVLCESCAESRSLRQNALDTAKDYVVDVEAVAFYECGNWRFATYPDDDIPQKFYTVDVPIRCRCGSHIDEVVYEDEF